MSMRSSLLSVCVIAALSLAACDAMPSTKTTTGATTDGPATPAQAAPLTPTGAPETLTVADESGVVYMSSPAATIMKHYQKVKDDPGRRCLRRRGRDSQ